MKFVTFLLLLHAFSFCLFAQKTTPETSTVLLKKGSLSQDSENENNSPDPKFRPGSFVSARIPTVASGEKKKVAEMPNGLQFIKEVVDKLIKDKYSFSLLSQHKYMINSCLGVKASVGEFSVEFSDPEVTINELGKVVLKLKVDEVKFSALKVRMRPCPKDFQCHFSERFNIGGLARDLTMRATIDPMAMVAASTGACVLAFQGSIPITWDIRALNLQPLQNNLDDVAKHMIEDALNGSTLNIFTDKFLKIAKDIFPAYFDICKEIYSAPADALDVVKGIDKKSSDKKNEDEKTDGDKTTPDEKQDDKKNNAEEKWEIKPSGLKGATGNVTVDLPKDVNWHLFFMTTDDKHLVKHDNLKSHTMMPGHYNITVTHLPLLNVPVQKGMNTRLKVGTLHMISTGQWSIYNEDKSKIYVTHHYPGKHGLPIGIYQIYINGQYQQVEIKDGEVTEF